MTSKTRPEPTPFVGVPAAAAELGLSIRTVQNLIHEGKIAAGKPNGGVTSAYIIMRPELDRVVAERAARADDVSTETIQESVERNAREASTRKASA